MRRILKIAVICAGIISAIGLEEYVRWIRPFLGRARQIENVVHFEALSRELVRCYEENGRYPADLHAALGHLDWFEGKDSWGNSLFYMSDAELFLLVSLGSDGRPDGTNYLNARKDNSLPGFARPCENFEADQILSDKGWYRACGK